MLHNTKPRHTRAAPTVYRTRTYIKIGYILLVLSGTAYMVYKTLAASA